MSVTESGDVAVRAGAAVVRAARTAQASVYRAQLAAWLAGGDPEWYLVWSRHLDFAHWLLLEPARRSAYMKAAESVRLSWEERFRGALMHLSGDVLGRLVSAIEAEPVVIPEPQDVASGPVSPPMPSARPGGYGYPQHSGPAAGDGQLPGGWGWDGHTPPGPPLSGDDDEW